MANTTLNEAASYSQTLAPNEAAGTTHLLMSALQQQLNAWPSAVNNGTSAPVHVYPQTVPVFHPAIADHLDWLDLETRQAYMESTVEQDIAWQIAINRKARGMTQEELAGAVGTKQSSIARAEDPAYGRHSLGMLTRIAHAFDCALRVKLIPYSELAQEVLVTSVEVLTVASFKDEAHLIAQR